MRFGAGLNISYFFKSKDVINQEVGAVLGDWAAQNNEAVLSDFDHILESFCVRGNEYASIESERNSNDDSDGLTGAERAAAMEAENNELRGVLKHFVAENIRPEASLDENELSIFSRSFDPQFSLTGDDLVGRILMEDLKYDPSDTTATYKKNQTISSQIAEDIIDRVRNPGDAYKIYSGSNQLVESNTSGEANKQVSLQVSTDESNRFDAIQTLYDNANYQDIPAYKLFSGAVDMMTQMRESSSTTRSVTNEILFPGMKMFTDLDGDGISDIGDALASFVSSDKGIVLDISRFTDASISASSDTEETRAFYRLSEEEMQARLAPLSCDDEMVKTERAEFLCVAQALSNSEKYRFSKAKTADEEDKERERTETEDGQRAHMKARQESQERKALAEKAAQESAARRKQSNKDK